MKEKFASSTFLDFYDVHELYRSQSGAVYKACFKYDRNVYVLKERKIPELGKKKDIMNEFKLLMQLSHPNVLCCEGWFRDEIRNSIFIVLEYCCGGDLSKILDQRRSSCRYFREEQIWFVFHQICLGLRHLHEHGIIHRDLKGLNIMCSKDGRTYKVGDLGVSRQVSENTLMLNTFYGTPLYLSPELVENKPYNEKTDIWSMGIILYEMCTFHAPFQGKTLLALAKLVLKGKYDPIPSQFSSNLERCISWLLNLDFKKRPNITQLIEFVEKRLTPGYRGQDLGQSSGSRAEKSDPRTARDGPKHDPGSKPPGNHPSAAGPTPMERNKVQEHHSHAHIHHETQEQNVHNKSDFNKQQQQLVDLGGGGVDSDIEADSLGSRRSVASFETLNCDDGDSEQHANNPERSNVHHSEKNMSGSKERLARRDRSGGNHREAFSPDKPHHQQHQYQQQAVAAPLIQDDLGGMELGPRGSWEDPSQAVPQKEERGFSGDESNIPRIKSHLSVPRPVSHKKKKWVEGEPPYSQRQASRNEQDGSEVQSREEVTKNKKEVKIEDYLVVVDSQRVHALLRRETIHYRKLLQMRDFITSRAQNALSVEPNSNSDGKDGQGSQAASRALVMEKISLNQAKIKQLEKCIDSGCKISYNLAISYGLVKSSEGFGPDAERAQTAGSYLDHNHGRNRHYSQHQDINSKSRTVSKPAVVPVSSKLDRHDPKPYNSPQPISHQLQYQSHHFAGADKTFSHVKPAESVDDKRQSHLFVHPPAYPPTNQHSNNAAVGNVPAASHDLLSHNSRPRPRSSGDRGKVAVCCTDLNQSAAQGNSCGNGSGHGQGDGSRDGGNYYQSPAAFNSLDKDEQGNGLKLPSMGYRPKTAGHIGQRSQCGDNSSADRNAAILQQMYAKEDEYKYPNSALRHNLQQQKQQRRSVKSKSGQKVDPGKPVLLHDYRSHLSPAPSRLPPQPLCVGGDSKEGEGEDSEEGVDKVPNYMQRDTPEVAKRTSFVKKKFDDGPPATEVSGVPRNRRQQFHQPAQKYNLVSGLVEER